MKTLSEQAKGKIRECAQRFRQPTASSRRGQCVHKADLCTQLLPEMGIVSHFFPPPIRMDSVGFADVQSEDELYDFDMDMDPPNWQQLVSREVLMGLKPYEIKRQEVINGEMEVLSYLAKLRVETFPWSFEVLKIYN